LQLPFKLLLRRLLKLPLPRLVHRLHRRPFNQQPLRLPYRMPQDLLNRFLLYLANLAQRSRIRIN
jgi:hypothetical protein